MKDSITIAARRGKVHLPWKAVGWRTRCRVWADSLEGGPNNFRSIDQFTDAYTRRIKAVLERNLSAGCAVHERETIDGPDLPTVWFKGQRYFIKPYCDDPAYLADHITNRAIGFGWSISLH